MSTVVRKNKRNVIVWLILCENTLQRVMCYTYSVSYVILSKYHGMHGYETRGAWITTVVRNEKQWFLLQASMHLVNSSFLKSFKAASTLKALKVSFKGNIGDQAFFGV